MNVVKYISIVILFSLTCACNNSGAADAESSNNGFVPTKPAQAIGQDFDVETALANQVRILPNACAIVPRKKIAETLGITVPELTLRNSTPRDKNPTHSSCFYKYDDGVLSNAGIMLQMMRNPNEEEFPEYVSVFIESFRTKGERGIDEEPIKYQKFEGFGDDGSYSTEGAKYFWRLGNRVIFGIAFNTTHTPEEQYRIATTLAKDMTENYLRIYKIR